MGQFTSRFAAAALAACLALFPIPHTLAGELAGFIGLASSGDVVLDFGGMDVEFVAGAIVKSITTDGLVTQQACNADLSTCDEETVQIDIPAQVSGADGVVVSGTYAVSTQVLTLTLSSDAAAATVDISLSDLTTPDELTAAINSAISALDTEDGVVTGMDFSGTTLTLTRSDGLPPLTQAGIGGSGGMSMADGVVSGGSVSGTTLTLTRTETLSDVTITGLPELDLSDDTPQTVHTVGVAGTGDEASRDDHRHAGVGTLTCREGIQCNQTLGAVVAEARLSSAAPEDVGATESAGGNDQTLSRSRHVHAGVTSITAGTGISVSPSDGQGTVTVTATGGGGGGGADDGVVDGVDYSETTGEVTLTRTVGADLTENLDEIIRPDGSGDLPDPSTRQDRVAISGDNLLHAIDHGATDKVVGFKAYGPDRVVDTGEPALLQDEANFQGSFPNPPSGTFSNDDFAWDRGSQVWLHRVNSVWITSGGPHGYAPGHLYATEAIAENHVTGTGYFRTGGVVIFGQGSAQRPYVITSFTAGTAESWQWDPIGDDPADGVVDAGSVSGTTLTLERTVGDDVTITGLPSGGGGASVTNDVILFGAPENESTTVAPSRNAVATMGEVLDFRTPDSTGTTGHVWTKTATEGEWAAIDAVDIAAYSSSATYERGSRNSIVTHANHVWVYVSTQRNTNHDPEQFPQYWWKVDTPIRVLNHDSATTTHWRSGDFFLTETGQLRIATATLSASPADIISDHTGADQEFLWLNEPGGGNGTTVTANPSGTDGADLIRIAIAGTNYNVAGRISWGFVIDTLLVPELNQDAISTARLVLEDSGLTHYLGFLGWTAADLDTIDHLPVGAHIGLRQGTTTRILEVEAEWDSTNNRYQVININDGVLLESASGAATELLLTAGTSGGGAGSNSVELWTGDIAVGTSNTWAAAGTDAVPSTARWILFNGGTLTDDVDDGAPADWRWINATDWRALTAASSGDTVADGTAMQFAEWPSTDVASTNFTRRDVKIGRTSTNTVLITSMDAGEDFAGAAIRYVTGFAGGSGGGSDLAVQEEGTEVASAATVLNFTGTGATATASDGTVTVNIPGGSGGGDLADGSVTTAKLADGAVTTIKLADDAVTGAKIADDTIHGGALIDGTIATIKIGDSQVTGEKLSTNAVSTGKVADNAITSAKLDDGAVTTAKVADAAITTAKLATNAAGEGKVPIDNTMQFDGSGDLGVNTERVVQEVSEWVQHFASGDSHDTSGHSGKYQEYTSPNTVRRIGSVQYDFDPLNDSGGGGTGKTYQVFVLELTGRNVDAVLGSSAVYSGNSLQHRFYFTDGVLINPNVRIGIGLHRTDGGNNEGLSVRFGTESQNSPRESYDDASEDFNFLGRFNHDRPTPSVNDTVGGTTTNQIYGNPEIFYQIIHTHESLVGDGTVSVSHLDSGSAADGTVSTADGVGGVAYEALPVASTTARGIVELATPTEVLSADTTRAATGAGVYSVTGLQVSSAERTAGSETGVRRFSPADVHSMIDTHAPSGGGGSDLQVADEGVSLTTAATAINFAGEGVTATASGTAVTVTVPADGVADSYELTRSGLTITGRIGRSGTLSDLVDTVDVPQDQYVDTVLHSISGSTLTTTIGRTGTLSDISDDDVLPVVTGGSVSGTTLTLTKAVGDAVTITGLPSGGGSGAGNPNATRIVTGATYDAGAGGNETIEAPSWRSCDFLFPVFDDSSEAAAANANSNRPYHGVDMFFASALDTDGSIYVGVSQNEGVRILSAAANDFLTFQWVGTSPAPGTSDTLDIWCLDAGGTPGSEASDNSIASGDGAFDETTIAVPTGTWGFVNFGDIGEHYSGEWHRFLVADLTGQTAAADGGNISDTNSLMFVANEEVYFFLGRTSGGNILVGSSNSTVTPSNVRMRTN